MHGRASKLYDGLQTVRLTCRARTAVTGLRIPCEHEERSQQVVVRTMRGGEQHGEEMNSSGGCRARVNMLHSLGTTAAPLEPPATAT
jgi:hypothetical protein